MAVWCSHVLTSRWFQAGLKFLRRNYRSCGLGLWASRKYCIFCGGRSLFIDKSFRSLSLESREAYWLTVALYLPSDDSPRGRRGSKREAGKGRRCRLGSSVVPLRFCTFHQRRAADVVVSMAALLCFSPIAFNNTELFYIVLIASHWRTFPGLCFFEARFHPWL